LLESERVPLHWSQRANGLLLLDQELASRGGSPTIVDERFTKVTTPLSSEQVCNFDGVMPLGLFDNLYRYCIQVYILH
jgi:hypothetical protein